MEKNEPETIAMILDDEGLGLQLGNSKNILRVHFERDGKAEPEPFSTVAIQKDKAVLWHEKGIEQKVKRARKQGVQAVNATYLEALKTVIEFHRALTIEEFCVLTGCVKKTVQNKIKTFPVKHFRRAGRGCSSTLRTRSDSWEFSMKSNAHRGRSCFQNQGPTRIFTGLSNSINKWGTKWRTKESEEARVRMVSSVQTRASKA